MRGYARACIVCATLLAPYQAVAQDAGQSGSEFTFDGDTALWAVAIYDGKTDAFEQVMARVRQALEASADAQRRRQAEGWKVVRLSTPMPDGTVGYVHMIHPVVPGADYSIMRILYDAFPEERQPLYDLYRGAFARNLSLATGSVAVNLARVDAPAGAVAPAPSSGAPDAAAPSTASGSSDQ
jgi:hypothetical protein